MRVVWVATTSLAFVLIQVLDIRAKIGDDNLGVIQGLLDQVVINPDTDLAKVHQTGSPQNPQVV